MRGCALRDKRLCQRRCSRGARGLNLQCTRQLSIVENLKSESERDVRSKVKPTFHKRPLPESLVSLSSKNGKDLFREALAGGGMESFFSLAEQFVTQSEPSYCALSSLAMVLNALNFDPKKVWKGAWRWVSEETLQCETQICGHSLEKVKRDGMNFDEFESLARCHGIRIRAYKHDEKSHQEDCDRDLTQFRSCVERVCSSDRSESFIVANFSRKVLGQTGIGHFSPIGGYHKEKDLVLIMDVARFKYPPFWVPLEVLWASMAVDDEKTQTPRGYFILSTWNSTAAVDLHAAKVDLASATRLELELGLEIGLE
jgi:glutathione gamma-glutamylcysteinyltransferase